MIDDHMESHDDVVADQLKRVATTLRARLPELCCAVNDRILEDIESLREDQRIIEMLTVSVESNVTSMLHIIGYQIELAQIEAPTAALEYARLLAQRGVPISDLVRAYRVGQACFMQWCSRELANQARDVSSAFAAGMRMSDITFGYIDRLSERVILEYMTERARWVRNTATVRAGHVRAMLEGGPIDVNRLEPALGYRLRQHHLGLVAWSANARRDRTLVVLERLAGQLADTTAEGARALFIPRDEGSAFVWLPLGAKQALAADEFDEIVSGFDEAVQIAVGEPSDGPDGFRVTMRQALRAHTIALTAARETPRVIRFARVAPVALLTSDIESAREWVHQALGPLAADDEHSSRLRNTLHVFLSTNSSYVETAERLSLHRNTVHYRVSKAEELRGRPIVDDRLEVELALLVCHWLSLKPNPVDRTDPRPVSIPQPARP